MTRTAVGASDIWVFRRDRLESKKKTHKWLLATVLAPLITFIALFTLPHPFIAIFTLFLGLIASLYCILALATSRYHAKWGLLELDGHEIRETLRGRICGRYDLRNCSGLISNQWTERPTDNFWMVQFGSENPFCIKREWAEFEALISEIERRSGKKFAIQVS